MIWVLPQTICTNWCSIPPPVVLATLGQIGVEQHWEAVRTALGLPPEMLPALRSGFWEGDRLDFALVDFIRQLRPPQ